MHYTPSLMGRNLKSQLADDLYDTPIGEIRKVLKN